MTRYEHTPRPLIEEHPHIRELIERQEVRTQDRIYHQKRLKNIDERNSFIKEFAPKSVMAFWCDTCRKDFMGEAIKQVEIDWTNPLQYIAFYRTRCVCGAWCMRIISDRHKDPYFYRSRKVARDRGEHHADTIQEYQTGYNMLYGRKNKS